MGRNFALDGAEIAIVGRACRLPGASNVAELWRLLHEGRCAVSTVPADRWPLARHGHPRVKQPGRSYTWAAGVLPDIWGFDPGVFRISPREAQQIDPQQRLLLELAFEACEDGGFAPSKLAGTQTGVYVGASALDYSTIGLHDPAVADPYYATGNTLSIVANRLSYVFDLHGPSLTIDTACSSSLVALHEARHALARGEVDVALVGGVNVLASPFGFISFSQATMLSPTGLCRAFAAEADGYVRAEGGVVLVLKTVKKAIQDGDRIHAVICGSGVKSDGRTSGISMPSETHQVDLLRTVYRQIGASPDSVVYVEAHGTGTRVGDPVEASALGKALGRARARPLPVGSIKTNIGHTEPASGLAGLLKATLALEHDLAPKSLHFDDPNPNIDFAGLNVGITGEPTALPRGGARRFAGVSSFGFGGTSAHVVISDPPVAPQAADAEPRVLMLTAQTEEALRVLAGGYARRLDGAEAAEVRRIVAATDHRRERMPERLVLAELDPQTLGPALARFAESGQPGAGSTRGTAVEDGSIVFVFSGNGSQWPGMGRAAYRANPVFREALAEVDSHFVPLSGWSLIEELTSPDLTSDLAHTQIAQPMIFAIQAACVRALAEVGVRPSMTMGHSVGEVAVAEAAGILSLRDAVRVIFNRSRFQQSTENTGGMAVIFSERDAAVELVARIPMLSIAAHNSQHCVAVAGPSEALARLAKLAPEHKIRTRRLELPYPFHTELMQPLKKPLLESLVGLAPLPGAIQFLSTITDSVMAGAEAGPDYWWRNVRDTVLFQEGVERAIRLGKRVFVEIGPRATVKSHLRDIADYLDAPAFIDCVLDEKSDETGGSPFEGAAMRLLAAGADVECSWAFGPDPGAGVELPAYPWRRIEYRFGETSEATGQLSVRPRHPLVGARDHEGTLEWRAILDPDVEPSLADHRVDGQVLLPGAALVEMGLAVAREWAGDDAALSGFEILQPLIFAPDVSREILCRISSSTATVEIMSRPRLSKTTYATHARGKIIQNAGPVPAVSSPSALSGGIESATIYEQAFVAGLEFGPAYRQLARAKRTSAGVIDVELTPQAGDSRFGLDPARLDSCFHGLVLLFADRESGSGAYLPVRFDDVRLIEPGKGVARACIRVKRHDARVIIADFDLFDGEGRLAATFRGARYQAVRRPASAGLEQLGLARVWIPMPESGRPAPYLRERLAEAPHDDGVELPAASLLIEGWATAAAYQLARRLATNEVVNIDALVLNSRLSPIRRPWVEAVFAHLEQSGLMTRSGSDLRVIDQSLPAPDAVYWTLAAQHPDRVPEFLLAAFAGAALHDLGDGKDDAASPSDGVVDAYELRSPSVVAAARTLGAYLDRIAAPGGSGSALRILQIGVGPATYEAVQFAARQDARLTIFDSNPRRLERARFSYGHAPETSFSSDLDSLSGSSFDLVVSAGGLSRLAAKPGALALVVESCIAGALVLGVEPPPSLFHELVLSPRDAEFGQREVRRSAESWKSELVGAGLIQTDVRLVSTGADRGVLLIAEAPAKFRPAADPGEVVVVRAGAGLDGFAATLLQAIESGGAACRIVDAKSRSKADKASTYVWLMGDAGGEGVAQVASHCLAIREMALAAGHAKARIFVAAPWAERPVADAIFSFVRTLANESQTIDFHRVDIIDPTSQSAERLAALIVSNAAETDIAIDVSGVQALRYTTPKTVSPDPESLDGLANRLEKSPEGGLDRLAWRSIERKAPRANEVEVEVVSTGLNFRDVMWALSILPDEMLEDGFAGPTLGLEFAGRVVRAGSAIERLRVGDAVVGLSGGAFSTHVVVDANHVAAVPQQLPIESAATIPVAFLTAYYGLISCADLQRGEWVLIHGGAGGVGLAALQIAQWRGARPIVTAGSPEKRALTLALGAEHAFDSRSGAFVEEVMRVTEGRGVSVVLNSLAGEAMERSLGLLQPFGRFVELGKRDYLANTPIGLRPFRRNLSYFGVDLDQLLSSRPELSHRLFTDILELFASGDFTPLPYSVFGHDEVVEAMRLMQQSGHVGKILVRPPSGTLALRPERPPRLFTVDSERNHLITGGLSGFGLAAAQWLVERGARHVTLIGRSGASNALAREGVARLRAQGAQVRVESLDIGDRKAAEGLFADLAQTMPPLAGVMHAAMVLEDAIVANMDEASLMRVLRPKIAGAANLDRLTRGLDLDYFVLFSSVAAVIGNPGQGAYVAANGFLEGLARKRHLAGLPALAVAWGGIADVGVLARHSATREALTHRVGVKGIKAQAALDLMAQALSVDGGPGGDGVIVIADMNWPAARAHLPVLKSPTYSRLGSDDKTPDAPPEGAIGLRELSMRLGPDQARRAVADVLVEEIARILRLPREDVSRNKPLAEIGLDSLMEVELMLSVESRFALDAPLGSSAGGFNVTDLAGHLLSMSLQNEQNFDLAEGLAKRHLGQANWGDIAPLMTALQEKGVNMSGAPPQSASA